MSFHDQDTPDSQPTKVYDILELNHLLHLHQENNTYDNRLFYIQGPVKWDTSASSKTNPTAYITGCYFVTPNGTPQKFAISTGPQQVRVMPPRYSKGPSVIFIMSDTVLPQEIEDKVVTERAKDKVLEYSIAFKIVLPKIISDLEKSATEVIDYVNSKRKNLNARNIVKSPLLIKGISTALITHPIYSYGDTNNIKIVRPTILDGKLVFTDYSCKNNLHREVYSGSRASTTMSFDLVVSKQHGARVNVADKHKMIIYLAPFRDMTFNDADHEMSSMMLEVDDSFA